LGLLFATKEAEYSSQAIRDYFDGKDRDAENPFLAYQQYADRAQDVIQTMLDCFWEWPLPFQRFAHMTHQEEIIDLFAGRVYGDAVHQYDSVIRMRRLLEIRANEKKAENMVTS
jgi:hypothetical protein